MYTHMNNFSTPPQTVAISHVKKYGADVEIEGLMLMMKKPNVAANSYGSIHYTGSEALTTADCFGEPNVNLSFFSKLCCIQNALNRI